MALTSPYVEHYYLADGVTTTFSFGSDFTPISESFVKCIIYFTDNTSCIPTYTVNMTSGYISIVTLTKPDGTVLTVPPAGSIVRLFRNTPKAQDITASQLQNYTSKQLEKSFDQIVAMIQEVSFETTHKTVHLTETQRDVNLDELKQANDGALIYWQFSGGKLKATNYTQDQVVLSNSIDYIEKDSSGIIKVDNQNIGTGIIHNDLSGRGVGNAHPISAITNLQETLDSKPDFDDLPVVNNNTITLTQGGQTKGSFRLNQNTDQTIDFDAFAPGYVTDVKVDDVSVVEQGVANIDLTDYAKTEDLGAMAYADKVATGDIADGGLAESAITNLVSDLAGKQATLTAGSNITISNNTISATDTTYTAGTNVSITNNVISATDTTYTAGNGLTLTGTSFSANVENNVTSTSTTNSLSANMGKELQQQINHLVSLGRFLSFWNCTTGLPETSPQTSPYTYKTGDWFRVGTVASGSGTNYKPSGTTYTTGVASTTVETSSVVVGQVYYFDGSSWSLQAGGGTTSTDDTTIHYNTDNNLEVIGVKSGTTYDSNVVHKSTETTNCLTAIPQDINLELSNGTLTLKAGSKVYVPNGSGVFNTVTTTADITATTMGTVSSGTTCYGFLSQDMTHFYVVQYSRSGTSTSVSANCMYYRTDTNTVYLNNLSSYGNFSFPLCTLTYSSGITSIDQVFNGFGYIGTSLFALPGVKGLIPNGRNSDGSLNNTEFTTSSVIVSNDSWSGDKSIGLSASGISALAYTYNEIENYVYDESSAVAQRCIAGQISYDTSTTSSQKQVFHAVDYSDVTSIADTKVDKGHQVIAFQAPTADNDYTWYRKYADGWVEMGGIQDVGTTNNPTTVSLPITMLDTNYFVTIQTYNPTTGAGATAYIQDVSVYNYTTTSFGICRGHNGPKRWMVCGMYAQ